MLFNESFYENKQKPNGFLYIRQAGTVNRDGSYTIDRSDSGTNVIAYIAEGQLRLTWRGRSYCFGGGSSLLLPHHAEYTIAADSDDPPQMLWCNIRGTMLDSVVDQLFLQEVSYAPLALKQFFAALQRLLAAETDNTYAICRLVLGTLCDIKEKAEPILPQPKPENGLAEAMEVYISNHIQDGLSLEEMARFFHLSANTLNRIFSAAYAVTPYRFYQRLRVEIAATMLRNSSMTVEDIAQRLHYTDRNYFSWMFKKAMGIPPVAYRKSFIQNRGDQA